MLERLLMMTVAILLIALLVLMIDAHAAPLTEDKCNNIATLVVGGVHLRDQGMPKQVALNNLAFNLSTISPLQLHEVGIEDDQDIERLVDITVMIWDSELSANEIMQKLCVGT